MLENYRGHRIAAINAGHRGWRAYIDMMDVTDRLYVTEEAARDWARACVDEAYEVERAPRGKAKLRVVAGTDVDRPRLLDGIGYADWTG